MSYSPLSPKSENRLWYCKQCGRLINPADLAGIVVVGDEHNCDLCLAAKPNRSETQNAGITPPVNLVEPILTRKQPHRVDARNSPQFSLATLVMLAGAAGALMSGLVAVVVFFIFFRSSQATTSIPATATQPQKAISSAKPSLTMENAPPIIVPAAHTEIGGVASVTPQEAVSKTTSYPVNPESPGLLQWPRADEKPKSKFDAISHSASTGAVAKPEADVSNAGDKKPDAVVTAPTSISPRGHEEHRPLFEFHFKHSDELEQWNQLEPGWRVIDDTLTCQSPSMSQRIEFKPTLNGETIISYDAFTQGDAGITFVDVKDPTKIDRVVVGGMHGTQAGFSNKAGSKLKQFNVADGNLHHVEITRGNDGLILKIDGQRIASQPADQLNSSDSCKVRLNLWQKSGSFSHFVIRKYRKDDSE